ncbi:hypothetical protein [Halomonas sp. IOP_31]|uniref:hypothetical protein n=1 Tax=Halomonas sp. IOP_31 TaxID=2876584 RepID=UPI001E3D7D91|nr:hypothetical protein [Halomonas sp. IOP_31]MCD6006910.1 hypothetical protein [Halomonas sp. IOP_31]
MANPYYDNSDPGQRFQPGATAKGGDVDGKFDEIQAGFDGAYADTQRSIKLPDEAGISQALSETALQRRGKVVGFDAEGKLALLAGFTWRGDWAASTEYFVNDVFRDAVTKNLYVVKTRHASGALADDISSGKSALAINVADVETAKSAAESARDTTLEARDTTLAARDTALGARNKAQQWAEEPEGSAVEPGAYSALHHRAKAENAQGLSEQARDDSQAAQGLSEQARNASQGARNLSQQYRDTALKHRDDAQAARDKARSWADESEDVEVELGKYSARHWAEKAAGIVADGVIDDDRTVNNLAWSSEKIDSEIRTRMTRAVIQTLTPPPTAPDLGEWRIDASAVSRHSGGSVASFEVTWWDGTSESVAATGGSATLAKDVNLLVGDTVTATVYTLDDIGNASLPKTVTAEVVSNDAPSGPISISAPTQTGKNSDFQVSMSGATDADGDSITYEITDAGTFAFAKTSGIAEGELVDVTAPDVTSDTDVTFSVVAVDDVGAQSATYSETVTVLAAQVIGVEMTATGGPGGTWNHVDEAGDAITSPTASWFNGHPVFGGISDVLVDGQDMVEVPKFYYKRGTSAAGNPAWWISDQPLTGFTVMPAFVLDGVEVAAFQYGKYQGSVDASNKLQSIPGVTPAVSTTLTDFLAYATNRNVNGVAGFRLHHYDMWLAIQWLYLIENATMDSQTATGEGHVNGSAALSVDDATVAQATYRGIVGLWGNVYQWMDGTRTLNSVIQRRSYNGSWTSTDESVPNGGSTQYPITFRATGDEQFVANTYSTSNDASATLPDYRRWRESGEYYPIVGGYWAYGAYAGLWYLYCGNSASGSFSDVGARLARIVS